MKIDPEIWAALPKKLGSAAAIACSCAWVERQEHQLGLLTIHDLRVNFLVDPLHTRKIAVFTERFGDVKIFNFFGGHLNDAKPYLEEEQEEEKEEEEERTTSARIRNMAAAAASAVLTLAKQKLPNTDSVSEHAYLWVGSASKGIVVVFL